MSSVYAKTASAPAAPGAIAGVPTVETLGVATPAGGARVLVAASNVAVYTMWSWPRNASSTCPSASGASATGSSLSAFWMSAGRLHVPPLRAVQRSCPPDVRL